MQYLVDIKRFISFLLNNPTQHALIISGPSGWAKTSAVRSILGDLGAPYQLLGAYSTPLALYNKLALGDGSCPKAGIVRGLYVLDDTHGVLTNPQALSILNAASWPSADQLGQRTVSWTSMTEKAEVPSFVFEGKLLILTNYMSSLPQARAFLSRALNCKRLCSQRLWLPKRCAG